MYTTAIDVKLLLRDTRFAVALEIIPASEENPHVLEFAATVDELGAADLVICDGEDISPAEVRAACRTGAVVILCCAEPTLCDEAVDSVDEIWAEAASLSYVRKRFESILQQIRQKKELRRTQIFLNTVIDSTPDLVWFKDVRGSHLKVNDAFCLAVGKSKEQVEGRGHYYIWDIPPDEYAKGEYVCMETEEIVMSRGELCVFDEKVKCRQGLRQFKTYKAPLVGDDGTLLGTVGVAQDVTRLAIATDSLSESQSTFNATIDTTHIHYWRYNPHNGRAILGKVYARELGLPINVENYPQLMFDLGRIHPDSVDAVRNGHEQMRGGTPFVFFDVHLIRPDETDCWRRVKYSKTLESLDSDLPYLGISEEIDDYKRIEKNFSISAQQNGITT